MLHLIRKASVFLVKQQYLGSVVAKQQYVGSVVAQQRPVECWGSGKKKQEKTTWKITIFLFQICLFLVKQQYVVPVVSAAAAAGHCLGGVLGKKQQDNQKYKQL